MKDFFKSERFKLIKQMLFQMAFGPTSLRIEVVHEDEMSLLEAAINDLANLIQETISEDPQQSIIFAPQNSITNLLLLDNQGMLAGFNYNLGYLLQYTEVELLSLDFQLLLSTNALLTWQEMQRKIIAFPQFEHTGVLVFRTKDDHFFSAFCSIFKIIPTDLIAVCFVSQNNLKRTPALYELPPHMILHASDVKGIYAVRDFILAHLLIEQSKFPLLDVAFKCGFTTYNNFYKAFKARFSYTPTSVTRRPH